MRRDFEGVSLVVFASTFAWLTALLVAAIIAPGGVRNVVVRNAFSVTLVLVATIQVIGHAQFKRALLVRHPGVASRRRITDVFRGGGAWRVLGATQDPEVLSDPGMRSAARMLAGLEFAVVLWITLVWVLAAGWMAIADFAHGSIAGLVFALVMTAFFGSMWWLAYRQFRGPHPATESV